MQATVSASSCLWKILLLVERRLYCSTYGIQSIGWEQGVVLPKAVRVSNKPQKRKLLWTTHNLSLHPSLIRWGACVSNLRISLQMPLITLFWPSNGRLLVFSLSNPASETAAVEGWPASKRCPPPGGPTSIVHHQQQSQCWEQQSSRPGPTTNTTRNTLRGKKHTSPRTGTYILVSDSSVELGRSRVKVPPESRTSPKCDHLILRQFLTISKSFNKIQTTVKHCHKSFLPGLENTEKRLHLWPNPVSAFC